MIIRQINNLFLNHDCHEVVRRLEQVNFQKKALPIPSTTIETVSDKTFSQQIVDEQSKIKVNRSIFNLLDSNLYKDRISLMSWMIVPLMIAWISINYIVGSLRQPSWQPNVLSQITTSNSSSKVLAVQPTPLKTQQIIPPIFHWKEGGLVTFWFDDAWLSQYTAAFPILEEAGFKASLAVPTKLVDAYAYMTWPQVKRVYYKGWEINPHSRTHNCNIQDLKPVQIDSEILGSKQDLEMEGLGSDMFIYVAPCGAESPSSSQVVRKNYTALRGINMGINPLPLKDPYAINIYSVSKSTTLDNIKNLLQEASDKQAWVILMFHQIDDTKSDYSVSPSLFKEIITSVKESKMPVVLPRQVLQLVVDK